MTDTATEARDYRGTVFLPKTAFPMKGDLPKREPAMLERWARLNIWQRSARNRRAARPSCCMTARPMPTATSISATR
jgi:isoleucyl-tRNA synthetase